MASIPPTSAVARQHPYRTYCQVQEWMENNIEPTKWGWIQLNDSLQPVATDLPPARDKVMNFVSCNCKAGCTGGCGCQRSGISCLQI